MARSAALLLAMAALPDAAHSDDAALATLRAANADVRREVLDNGLICIVKADPSAPVVAVQIWVGTGAVHEEQWLGAGLSHYMEHMIFKGTTNRGPGEISKAIDGAGGDINAYTAQDRTVFLANLPSAHWKLAVDVLADAVMNASLPADEWEREKNVILREFAMGYDSPDRVLSKLLWATAFRVHPYRVPVIGYEEVFRAMTRDDLVAFFRRHYVPDNMIVSVVGDIDADAVLAHLRGAFASFRRQPRAPVVLPQEPKPLAPREARQTGAYESTRLVDAWHTVPLGHPDAVALDVLAAAAGQGRSSRLEHDLKETRQIAHEISAWSFTPKDVGLFGISATFDPAREAEVAAAIDAQVAAWREVPFRVDEIEKVKRQMLVNELSSLQSAAGQASSYASGEFYAGNPRFSEHYLAALEALTPEHLRDVARRYLTPDARTRVVLAPAQTAPTSSAATAAAMLDLQRVTLSNGVPLIVRTDHRLPFVHVAAALSGGLLSETEADNGITQLMADLLTRGTPTRTAEQIAREAERLGLTLNAFAGRNSFGISGQALAGDTATLLGLLSDCLLRATFPDGEVEKQRRIQLAAIRESREQPMFVAQEALRGAMFPAHPYRWNVVGSEATVGGLTRERIAAHHRRLVTTSNLVVSIFGDITADDARRLAESAFSATPVGGGRVTHVEAAPPALPARVEAREPREQAILLAAYPAPSFLDPRSDAIRVLQNALSGLSSDLAIEIRDKRGLVYYVGASALQALDPGFFALYAGSTPEAIPEIESLMARETARIAQDGLREEEFSRAREQLIAEQAFALQNNGDLAVTAALNELYGLGYRHGFETADRLRRLTAEDLRLVAADLFLPDRMATSIVLPLEPKEKTDE